MENTVIYDVATQRKPTMVIYDVSTQPEEHYDNFNTYGELKDYSDIEFNTQVNNYDDSITCSDCGKLFQDRGQKMKPKYLLNRHRKRGMCFKYIKSNIIDKLNGLDINKLKQIRALIDNF